ncbi:MAG: DUF2934 domain-containing protein [Vicinamibacteria bacterium]
MREPTNSAAERTATAAAGPAAHDANPFEVFDVDYPPDAATAARAYQKYVQRGRVDGHDVQDWFEARQELKNGMEETMNAVLGLYEKGTR